MEKLVYVGWRPDGVTPEELRVRMLGDVAPDFLARGARGLGMLLADDRVVMGLRMGEREPAAVVSLWLDTHLDRAHYEAVLAGALARPVGYLATESVPLPNRRHVVPLGERIPGLYTVGFLEQPDRLDYETWLELWQGRHTAVAIQTQRTFLYVQNVLWRDLTPDAPPWTAIVEEAFPAEAATDPLMFYAAKTTGELAIQQGRMMESCQRFIDVSRFESVPMSAYVLARPSA